MTFKRATVSNRSASFFESSVMIPGSLPGCVLNLRDKGDWKECICKIFAFRFNEVLRRYASAPAVNNFVGVLESHPLLSVSLKKNCLFRTPFSSNVSLPFCSVRLIKCRHCGGAREA